MIRAVLADLHLGQREDRFGRFLATVEDLRRGGAEEVIFLGDLFRTLIGFPKFWDELTQRGLEELRRLREAGIRVVLVEGNRDFFLDAGEMDPFRDLCGAVHSFAAGGRRFLLEHGDLVNRSDRSYRAWRAVSKSPAARLWARTLPLALARGIVRRTEARLAKTNFSYRRELPVDDLTAASRRHFAAGVDVVLWGHFHRPWRLEENGREAWVVPAWLESGAVVWIGEGGEISVRESGEPEAVC